MLAALHHVTEVADDSATLYLSGRLCAADSEVLRHACAQLPMAVRALRLDLHGVSDMSDDAMAAVRVMLGYWRESRGGSFRLSMASAHLVATCDSGAFADRAVAPALGAPCVVERLAALTGMYL